MTALFSARRRAEEFAAAVDGRAGHVSEALRPLVSVATALQAHEHDELVLPRQDFAADLRARLMTEAEQALVPGAPLVLPVRKRGPRERRLVAAASVVVLFGGTAGMAAAAQQALPGEALYPIKRGLERAEAELSVSTAGRGQDLLHQANDRLAEVEGLLADGSMTAVPQVPATIDDFTAQAQEGSGLLLASFEETRDPAAVLAVREFTASGIVMLQDLARNAPAEAQDDLAAAALALSEIDSRAVALCDTCGGDLPDLEVPGIFLAAAEVDRAFTVVQGRLLELDNSHPFVVGKVQPTDAEDTISGATGGGDGSASTDTSGTGSTSDPELDLTGESDVTKSDQTVKKKVDDTVGDLADGISGAVETILPDPELTLD